MVSSRFQLLFWKVKREKKAQTSPRIHYTPPCLIVSALTWENLAGNGPAGAALSSSENQSYKGSLCWSGTENCTLAAALRLNQRWATLEKTWEFSVCISPPSTSFYFLLASPCLSFAVCLCLSVPQCPYLSIKYIFILNVAVKLDDSNCLSLSVCYLPFSPSVPFSFHFSFLLSVSAQSDCRFPK